MWVCERHREIQRRRDTERFSMCSPGWPQLSIFLPWPLRATTHTCSILHYLLSFAVILNDNTEWLMTCVNNLLLLMHWLSGQLFLPSMGKGSSLHQSHGHTAPFHCHEIPQSLVGGAMRSVPWGRGLRLSKVWNSWPRVRPGRTYARQL